MLGISCQICGKRQATTHLTEIDPISGERREAHLCATCVEQLDLKLEAGPPPIEEILANKLANKTAAPGAAVSLNAPAPAGESEASGQCPQCGLTFAEFAVNNRFGCASCYTAFGERAQTMLSRYHGNSLHVGRVPKVAEHHDDLGIRRAQLDAALREAVANEAYERAAQLRDEIRRLDEQQA